MNKIALVKKRFHFCSRQLLIETLHPLTVNATSRLNTGTIAVNEFAAYKQCDSDWLATTRLLFREHALRQQ
jgi:hypothetical protein